jgi:hypothetical protein
LLGLLTVLAFILKLFLELFQTLFRPEDFLSRFVLNLGWFVKNHLAAPRNPKRLHKSFLVAVP